jgi:small-conductance mechanosensitive channel
MEADVRPPEKRRGLLKERLKRLVAEYGALGIIVYFAIYAIVLASAYVAISLFGWKPESAAAAMGAAAAAWAVGRITLPFRLVAAVLLTPIVARVLERLRLRRPRPPA